MKGLVIDNQLYHLITRNKKMTLFVKKKQQTNETANNDFIRCHYSIKLQKE